MSCKFSDSELAESAVAQQFLEFVEYFSVPFTECGLRAAGQQWARGADEEPADGRVGLG
jgi:hypothetical protein